MDGARIDTCKNTQKRRIEQHGDSVVFDLARTQHCTGNRVANRVMMEQHGDSVASRLARTQHCTGIASTQHCNGIGCTQNYNGIASTQH